MSVLHEHWCSNCKKELDKKKDKYTEINMVNPDKKESKKKGLHTRVFICEDCMKKEEVIKGLESIFKRICPDVPLQRILKSFGILSDIPKDLAVVGDNGGGEIVVDKELVKE